MTTDIILKTLYDLFDIEKILEAVLRIIVILLGSILLYWVVRLIIKRLFSITFRPKRFRFKNLGNIKKRQKTIEQVILSIWQYAIWVVAFLLVLASLGINVQTILAGAGVIGVIFAVGSQRLIQDFLDGFFNIFEDNLSVGDFVEIDGVEGRIIDIRLRDIKIKSWSGEIHIIPNSKIGHLINYSLDHGKAIVEIRIAYEVLPEKLIDLLTTHLEKMKAGNPNILTTPTIVGISKMDELGYHIRISCETMKETHWSVQRYLRQELIQLFQRHGIPIAENRIRIIDQRMNLRE
ncbi:MAG TPA: mechanosensitive ion channel family protein [Haloplasmataceae bacterium]